MAAGQDPRAGRRADARPGDGLVRAGGVVFGLGLIAVLVVVLPFFFGKENWPLPLNLAAGVLPPLGLALALAGLVRSARRTARDNRSAAPQR
jgi:peptidoglycan/LPS O-acetylase OafA/YrhL